ncbi:MAG: diguanylate cyclase [Phycisphaerae bacterium]|nr:diguanylate cyclase [Phycisphaerae bacterium]
MIQDLSTPVDSRQQMPLLLIEPDPQKRSELAGWLSKSGFPCRAVEQTEQGLEFIRNEPVCLVMMNADASSALDVLRPALDPSQPLLVYGPNLDSDARGELLRRGADEAMTAAGPSNELADRLRSLLRQRALRQDLAGCRLQFRENLVRQQKLAQRIRRQNRRLREMAFSDPLTGLNNVRFFRQWMATQFEIARRYKLLMSVLMIDIDNFKRINDGCGHPFGDYVLSRFGEILRQQVRSSDVVARMGGDEFAVGLVETGRQDAVRFGRRLLRAVASSSFEYYGQAEVITISIGEAGFPEDAQVKTADQLMLFADQALYKAKANGRNDLACWHELDADLRARLAKPVIAGEAPIVSSQPTLCLIDEEV